MNLQVWEAKFAAGEIDEETIIFMRDQQAKIDNLAKLTTRKITDKSNDLTGLVNHIYQRWSENKDVSALFEYIAYLLSRVKEELNYEPDITEFASSWDIVELPDLILGLAAFKKIPGKDQSELFPNLLHKPNKTDYVSARYKHTLNGEEYNAPKFIVESLKLKVEDIKRSTIEDVKSKLDEKVKTGEVDPEEYLKQKSTIEKIENGEEVDLPKTTKTKSKNIVEKEVNFYDEEL